MNTYLEAELPRQYMEPMWYAAYTSANHEKRVAEQLHVRAVQHFLPTYESIRRWKDRKVKLHFPLYPGYVFVRVALRDRLHVLQIPGIARLVGFGGIPTPLPQEEVDRLRSALGDGVRAEPHPYLSAGRRALIKHEATTSARSMITMVILSGQLFSIPGAPSLARAGWLSSPN